jgi:predicted nucleic acid-binding protein
MAKVTVDTNLLVYAIDTADQNKHRTVHTLLDTLVEQDTVVSLQALAEFFHVVTRKGRLSTEEARDRIGDWQALFPMIAAGPNTLSHAIDGLRRFQMPFWDAMLWATAQEAGVTVLLSEDFQDLALIEGVRFVNPFSHEDLSELLTAH